MAQLTFLDIFAGIGGMRRGLESAGHRCVGYIEWDKWARKSYEAIFNSEGTGEWSATDVTTVRASELPTADIWGFGFPCQDLSVAGKQLGFNGNRSSLFFTVVGLIRELPEDRRPEWLIAENVMGFLSSNRGWDFLAAQVALDEIGYDTEWEVFNATQFGIPQNRQRVFLVGHSRRAGRREVFPIRQVVATSNGRNAETSVESRAVLISDWRATVKKHIAEVNEPMFTLRASAIHGVMVSDHIRKLTPLECWRLMGREDWEFYAAKNAGVSDTQLYKQAGNSLIPQIVQAIGERIAVLSESSVEAVALT